jgi:hypothetical protein
VPGAKRRALFSSHREPQYPAAKLPRCRVSDAPISWSFMRMMLCAEPQAPRTTILCPKCFEPPDCILRHAALDLQSVGLPLVMDSYRLGLRSTVRRGVKRGSRPGPGHKPRRPHNQSSRGDRPQRPPFALSPERRPMLRWQSRRAFAEAFAPAQETVGRQGLRLCRVPRLAVPARHHAGHPSLKQVFGFLRFVA